MGTRVAPTFANIFMADFERKHVYSHPLQPDLRLRFIDDIFMIWNHGAEALDCFTEHLNRAHPTIHFTVESSTSKVHFLDVWIIKDDKGIHTDLFVKPTDSNMTLHYDSAHPRHCREGIPYGQFLRLRRICTHTETFLQRALVKTKQFLDRGYPKTLLKKELIRATLRDRSELLTPTSTPPSPEQLHQQILVTTFHPSFKGLRPLVNSNWDVLGGSHKTSYLHHKRLVAGLRKPPNINDLLVRARTDFHPQQPTAHNQPGGRTYNICSTNNCRYCARLDTSGRIISTTTGRSYITRMNVSCKSSNLIYCIHCTRCGSQYVGQTERKLMARLCEHFAKVTHSKLETDMGRHFCKHPHQGIDDMKIHVLDFIKCHPQSATAEHLRDQRESHWIHTLGSLAPQGLNLRDTPRYRKRRNTV